jgi:hypothetical protein
MKTVNSQNKYLYEGHGLMSCKAVFFGESPTFCRNTSPPSSGLKNNPIKETAEAGSLACRLFLLASRLAYSSTLKMAAICLSEASSSLQKTRSYESEDGALHSNRSDNLTSKRLLHWWFVSLSLVTVVLRSRTQRVESNVALISIRLDGVVLCLSRSYWCCSFRNSRHRMGTHATDMAANKRSQCGSVRILKTCPKKRLYFHSS